MFPLPSVSPKRNHGVRLSVSRSRASSCWTTQSGCRNNHFFNKSWSRNRDSVEWIGQRQDRQTRPSTHSWTGPTVASSRCARFSDPAPGKRSQPPDPTMDAAVQAGSETFIIPRNVGHDSPVSVIAFIS